MNQKSKNSKSSQTSRSDFEIEMAELDRNRDEQTIKRFRKYFTNNDLLSNFPFQHFDRKQQLDLAARIENASILHAACNLLPDAMVTPGNSEIDLRRTLEWNLSNIRRLQSQLSGTEITDEYYVESSRWIALAENFFSHIITCPIDKRVEIPTVLREAKERFFNYSLEEQELYLIHYVRFVEDCICAILYMGSVQKRKYGSTDFPVVIPRVCAEYIAANIKLFTHSTPNLPITDAFLWYTRHMEFLEQSEVNAQIRTILFDHMNHTIAAWDPDCLDVLCETSEEALDLGLQAIQKKARSADRKTILKLHNTLKMLHTQELPPLNSSTWALLGYVLFKCDKKDLPILGTRRDRDVRSKDERGHSKGLLTYSLKQFASDISNLPDDTSIEIDMRMNYINEIIVLGYAIINGTDCDLMNYVATPMRDISRSLSSLFLCYNAQTAANVAGEVLELFWRSFVKLESSGNTAPNGSPLGVLNEYYHQLRLEWGLSGNSKQHT